MTDAEVAREERARGIDVVAQVLPYIWPPGERGIKVRVVIAMAALVMAKIVAVSTPFFYKEAVDALAGDTPDSGTVLALGAVGLTVAYGGARLLNILFQQLRDVVFARVAQRALRKLALRTFQHIHALSLRFHITRKTGAMSRVMERGVKGVSFLLRFLLFSIGPLVLELVMICAVLVTLFDVRYLLVVVVTMIAYVWFTFAVTEWRVRIRRQMNNHDNEANQRAIDSLLNFETVKYFGAESREAERYDGAMQQYEGAALKTAWSLGAINIGQAVIVNAGLVIVMVMAARGVSDGTLTVGDFVMVNAYMMQVVAPLDMLGFVYREIRQALVDMGEMFGLLGQPADVLDKEGAAELAVTGGAVALDDVHFGYDAARPILKGVSLSVPAGATLAIVGATGSGKSTIGRLLFRFYDVDGGSLTIDGQDVRDVTQQSLHEAIGVVPQDTVLFNDTLLYNIAYGRPEASQTEIEAAARAAEIHEFIMALPDGYDTQVGERGLKLSGGEKQRVGIARTILKDPPILLLDEATSALDTETERDIQRALQRMGRDRTVIMIAHRLSTVAEADKIVVLDAGQVVEEGTHEALLAKRGRYAELWDYQRAEKVG
ncbi:MAG: ABC transporter ATP-binding protein/permease [Oceanicola sp.]|nr:ABC transporter ATP-binding protein/permease [Oceanicola sp.]